MLLFIHQQAAQVATTATQEFHCAAAAVVVVVVVVVVVMYYLQIRDTSPARSSLKMETLLTVSSHRMPVLCMYVMCMCVMMSGSPVCLKMVTLTPGF